MRWKPLYFHTLSRVNNKTLRIQNYIHTWIEHLDFCKRSLSPRADDFFFTIPWTNWNRFVIHLIFHFRFVYLILFDACLFLNILILILSLEFLSFVQFYFILFHKKQHNFQLITSSLFKYRFAFFNSSIVFIQNLNVWRWWCVLDRVVWN